MKYYMGIGPSYERQVKVMKALQRLDDRTFIRHYLCKNHMLSANQLAAASVLQFAAYSSSFNYLNKGIVEHVQGYYLSEHDMLVAATALGFKVRDRSVSISKSWINALEAVQRLGCVIEFPPAQEQ